jgi:hypothetical protein
VLLQSAALGDWYPVLLITLFNIADLLGKNLPFGRFQLSQQQLLGLSVLRLGFLPLFVGATLAQAPAPVIALLTFSLGLSNGWVRWTPVWAGRRTIPGGLANLALFTYVYQLMLKAWQLMLRCKHCQLLLMLMWKTQVKPVHVSAAAAAGGGGGVLSAVQVPDGAGHDAGPHGPAPCHCGAGGQHHGLLPHRRPHSRRLHGLAVAAGR